VGCVGSAALREGCGHSWAGYRMHASPAPWRRARHARPVAWTAPRVCQPAQTLRAQKLTATVATKVWAIPPGWNQYAESASFQTVTPRSGPKMTSLGV
jgi:hypothetical protein